MTKAAPAAKFTSNPTSLNCVAKSTNCSYRKIERANLSTKNNVRDNARVPDRHTVATVLSQQIWKRVGTIEHSGRKLRSAVTLVIFRRETWRAVTNVGRWQPPGNFTPLNNNWRREQGSVLYWYRCRCVYFSSQCCEWTKTAYNIYIKCSKWHWNRNLLKYKFTFEFRTSSRFSVVIYCGRRFACYKRCEFSCPLQIVSGCASKMITINRLDVSGSISGNIYIRVVFENNNRVQRNKSRFRDW